MKILKISIVLAALALFIFACTENKPANSSTADSNKPVTNSTAAPQPTAAADELAGAKKIFSDRCVRCHKEDGTGGVTDIEGTQIKAPNLTTDKMKNEPDA